MPKQVIVIMQNHYPFGQCEQSTNEKTRVFVRKIYSVGLQERNKLLEQASIMRKLKSQQMIKVESVLEEDESIHFLFEYVPIRLEAWISDINDQFIQNFRDQLIKFSSYLANNFIKVEFTLKNIGMDQNYGAKYFLDPGFTYDPSVNKQRLKSQYIRDITNLFRPYIEGGSSSFSHNNNITKSEYSSTQQEKNTNKNSHLSHQQQKPVYRSKQEEHNNVKADSEKQTYHQNNQKSKNSAISPPTENEEYIEAVSKDQQAAGSNKTKEKLEKYYQQMNASMDVQNEKLLQEFMDVLDDEQEEQKPTQKKPQQEQNTQIKYAAQESNKALPPQPNQRKISEQLRMVESQQMKNSSSQEKGPQFEKNEEVVWNEAQDLQDRVQKAIQTSKMAIKKFQSIKGARK